MSAAELAKRYPDLKAAWDEYGHAVPFEELHAIKTDRGCYAVVCWKTPEGKLSLADLARGRGEKWEMQNDGFSPDITEAEWKKLSIVPECDWFRIPGHAEYLGL